MVISAYPYGDEASPPVSRATPARLSLRHFRELFTLLRSQDFDDAKFESWNRRLSPLAPTSKGGHGPVGDRSAQLYELAVELRDRLRFR